MFELSTIFKILNEYSSIDLGEMDSVQLMNRTDAIPCCFWL
jgi:hypothetical protein